MSRLSPIELARLIAAKTNNDNRSTMLNNNNNSAGKTSSFKSIEDMLEQMHQATGNAKEALQLAKATQALIAQKIEIYRPEQLYQVIQRVEEAVETAQLACLHASKTAAQCRLVFVAIGGESNQKGSELSGVSMGCMGSLAATESAIAAASSSLNASQIATQLATEIWKLGYQDTIQQWEEKLTDKFREAQLEREEELRNEFERKLGKMRDEEHEGHKADLAAKLAALKAQMEEEEQDRLLGLKAQWMLEQQKLVEEEKRKLLLLFEDQLNETKRLMADDEKRRAEADNQRKEQEYRDMLEAELNRCKKQQQDLMETERKQLDIEAEQRLTDERKRWEDEDQARKQEEAKQKERDWERLLGDQKKLWLNERMAQEELERAALLQKQIQQCEKDCEGRLNMQETDLKEYYEGKMRELEMIAEELQGKVDALQGKVDDHSCPKPLSTPSVTITPSTDLGQVNRKILLRPDAAYSNMSIDKVFTTIDYDRSGTLSAAEVRDGMLRMFEHSGPQVTEKLRSELELDNLPDLVDLDRFVLVCQKLKLWNTASEDKFAVHQIKLIQEVRRAIMRKVQDLREIYKEFSSAEGMTAAQFKALTKSVAPELSPMQLQLLYQTADSDGSGAIDFEEFYSMIQTV